MQLNDLLMKDIMYRFGLSRKEKQQLKFEFLFELFHNLGTDDLNTGAVKR